MKIVSERLDEARGKRRVTVEVDANSVLIEIKKDAFYELGEPADFIVQGDVIANKQRVTWCSLSQAWVCA